MICFINHWKAKNCNYIVLEFYMLGKMIWASNFSGFWGSNSHLGSSIFLPFFFSFFSKLGFVNEKWDTSKKSYFSLVLSERKVYCVFAFFYVHGFFFVCLQSMQQAENPSFIQRLLYHPVVGIVSLTRFLRGFLAQFSMFYWPAMYCKSRLAFVCIAYYVHIWKALNKLWCSRMKKVCCIVLVAMKFQ